MTKTKKKPDVIDNINTILKAAQSAKICPVCGGTLLQIENHPRCFFCVDCFRLYGLHEYPIDRWLSLHARRIKGDHWKRRLHTKCRGAMCAGEDCGHGLAWHEYPDGACHYEFQPDGTRDTCGKFRLRVSRADTKRKLKQCALEKERTPRRPVRSSRR